MNYYTLLNMHYVLVLTAMYRLTDLKIKLIKYYYYYLDNRAQSTYA